jgi:hypothetical protein
MGKPLTDLNIVLGKLNLYVSPPDSTTFMQFKEPSKVAKSIMNFFYIIMIHMNECQPTPINLLGSITTSTNLVIRIYKKIVNNCYSYNLGHSNLVNEFGSHFA